VFDNIDQFRLDRGRSPHLAFGHGPHACLGSALARSVARIAFNVLLDRLDDIALAEPGTAPDYDVESYVLHGMRSLELSFAKAGA
jgi:cytochrome P450